MRKTKIIATIGPASDNEETMRELALAGMDCARFNFSHDAHSDHARKINLLKKVRDELGIPIATLLDTKGPEIRIGDFENGSIYLNEGDTFTFVSQPILGSQEKASTTLPSLYENLKAGDTILIDDGKLSMKVEEIRDTDIVCTVLNEGKISNHKGINLPGIEIKMPYISETDRSDIIFGCSQKVDFMALSFVRCADDVKQVRRILEENGGSKIRLIAKIENLQGVRNLPEILEVSDGIMVARGDMGVEIPFTHLPSIQKRIIEMCNREGKLVITATQMLDSMISNPRPTRAEISDVANAVYDGTSAIMLSGETAAGHYPAESLRTMSAIAEEAERHKEYIQESPVAVQDWDFSENTRRTIILASCTAAKYQKATAMVVATHTGHSARILSSVRPDTPIIALTDDKAVLYQLNLEWNIKPLLMETKENAEDLIASCIEKTTHLPFIKKGDALVILGNSSIASVTDFMKLHIVE